LLNVERKRELKRLSINWTYMKKNWLILAAIGLAVALTACKKAPKGIDGELFALSEETEGFVWFKFQDAFLDKSAGTGHNFPILKTRFNATAATQLDNNGRVLPDAVFPQGSVIVKELYDDNEKFKRYATMWKNPSNEYADANGWVWGYIEKKGKVVESAELKGASCTGCHAQSGSIDGTLMNNFFP
jgi:hypothetical protein